MPKKLTHEEAISNLIAVHGTEKYDYSRTAYTTSRNEITVWCNSCSNEFPILYSNHKAGKGCKTCGHKKQGESLTKTNEEFLVELRSIAPTVIPLEQYRSNRTPVKCRCSVCEHEWSAKPNDLFSNNKSGCPKCSNKVPYSFESLSEAIYKVHGGEITLLPNQEIKGVMQKYWMRHNVCGHEWNPVANNVLNQGQGCPICNKSGFNTTKPSVLYILKITGNSQFVGFGISNVYKKRMTVHKRNLKRSSCKIASEVILSMDGYSAQELEKYIKGKYNCCNSDIEGFKTESLVGITPEQLLKECIEWLDGNKTEILDT